MSGTCNVSLNVLTGKSSAQTLHPGKRINPQKAEHTQSTYRKHSHTCNRHLFPWAPSVWSEIAIHLAFQYSHNHWSIEPVIATFHSLSNSDPPYKSIINFSGSWCGVLSHHLVSERKHWSLEDRRPGLQFWLVQSLSLWACRSVLSCHTSRQG